MSEFYIITAAALGGSLNVRGQQCEYLVRGLPEFGGKDAAVPTAEALRTLLAHHRPMGMRLRFQCAPAERRWWSGPRGV